MNTAAPTQVRPISGKSFLFSLISALFASIAPARRQPSLPPHLRRDVGLPPAENSDRFRTDP